MGPNSHTPAVHECGCEICRKFRETAFESVRDKDGYERQNEETLDLHRAINRLMGCADERIRRVIAGLVSRLLRPPPKDEPKEPSPLGKTAIITGLSPRTIRRGWDELKSPEFRPTAPLFPRRYSRRPGGGRKPKST
jgi:hypothetical protein